jgi:hypothetical protein
MGGLGGLWATETHGMASGHGSAADMVGEKDPHLRVVPDREENRRLIIADAAEQVSIHLHYLAHLWGTDIYRTLLFRRWALRFDRLSKRLKRA